ncbi:MAG: FtsX-like permease family protein [Lachnospiraceae bacterium]|nr:FtsX-like permease family protein [Lachnospiraceae bacterium]
MRKSAITKSTFREIKQSFGRFAAILTIVALGVGFFAGLKVTKRAMIATMEAYWERTQFYDYRIMSTLGFEEEDAEFLRQQEQVRAVEGAQSFDIIYVNQEGNEGVLKAHSLTTSVNQIQLTEGRMPEQANECVVDANLFDASSIGSRICLAQDNEPEDMEHFAYTEYEITGIVRSPLYIQFERGNTSLGTGTVSGFFYLLPEGFAEDYYTEIYVKFDADFPLYGDEYESFMDGKEDDWEAFAKQAADQRFQRIINEADEKIASAEEELEQEKTEAQGELSAAKEELEEGEQQLSQGERQLTDARSTLEEGRQQLADKEAELAAAKQTIADKEAELVEGERALNHQIASWNTQSAELDEAEEKLEEGFANLAEQRLGLDALEASYPAGTMPEDVAAQIAANRALLSGYEAELNSRKAQLEEGRNALAAGWNQIQGAQAQMEAGKTALAAAKTEVAEGERQLASARAELTEAEQTLSEQAGELESARQEYEEGVQEYQEGLEEFETQIGDAQQEIEDARQELADMDEPETYVLDRNTNVGYVCYDSDSSIVEGIANVFPVFFFLVAALVCMTTMNRMVEEQRTQIGVWKALGYSDGTIMSKYIIYSGTAAVTGCVLGFLGGTWLFPRVIWETYRIIYQLDDILYIFDWKLALLSLLVSVLCSIGVTWLSCRRELNLVSAELMRPKAPAAGKRVFLEYVPFIWKRLSFLRKVSVRNIFRYKKRLFMMITGISGCTALLLTGFGVRDSVVHVADVQFDKIQIYDMSVTCSGSAEESLQEEISGSTKASIAEYLCVMETSMDVVAGNSRKDVNLVVFDGRNDISAFLNLCTLQGEPLDPPGEGEAILTHKAAQKLGLEEGDTCLLQNADMESMTVRITGISQNFIDNYVFIGEDTYTGQMHRAPEFKTAYINIGEGEDAHRISADLMNRDGVVRVTVNQDIRERVASMMQSMDLIVAVLILCAAGLAFIVLYNLTNINITERVREIATVKVLGFYRRETASYVFRENVILTALGTVLGLVLGHFLHLFVMSQIQIDLVSFDVRVEFLSFVYSIILTFLFAWFVNCFMRIKLEKVSMTESLKSVD